MADQQDNTQRTEEATPKRLQEARKRGDAPKSQEVIAAAMLFGGVLVLWWMSGPLSREITLVASAFIDHPHAFIVDGAGLQSIYRAAALSVGAALTGVAVVMVAASLVGNLMQAAPVLTASRMKPSLEKLSPIAGAKRIFGPSGLFNFGKGVGKIVAIGVVMVLVLWPERDLLLSAMQSDAGALMTIARDLTMRILAATIVVMVVLAALDYGFQRHSWKQRLKMTKEEVRRELKESEGDPQVKGRLKQMRDARGRQRMIAAVKDATVLIMNPTHYAVALAYEEGMEAAPICCAKGHDETALRMREAAQEHAVPVIENPPLARALYDSVTVEEEIPIEHYEAVAEVIGFILKKARQAQAPTP